MYSTALTVQSRKLALEAMSDDEGVDVLVIGGGVTGAGIALDAATRGLRTAIVEMQDWSQGTSSRSSKLVHGGLRYLYQLDFKLVAEALRERGLLLTTIAPHLVKAQPFLWPLKVPVVERSYSAVGVGMYDVLAQIAHPGSVPIQKHYSRKGALTLFPGMKADSLTGAIRFYDARVDDSRLVIDLIRTAAGLGALAASRTQVKTLTTDRSGRVDGAEIVDLEADQTYHVRARHVINATGVWTEETQKLSGASGGLEVLASKGIHIVVPKERISGQTGIFVRTEKSVLFIIPWQRYWVIGTTDTPWHYDRQHPTATSEDIDYVLDHANEVLSDPLTRDDIIGVYAGLRPLLQPGTKDESASTKVSREHTVTEAAPGLTVIAGGKLTTYRPMAEDAVDFALGVDLAKRLPSQTDVTPLVGAVGYEAFVAKAGQIAGTYGWTHARVEHLLDRYGSEVGYLLDRIDDDPSLGEPLEGAPDYLKVEVVFAVTHEGAFHLEDVINHRIRLCYEQPDRGAAAASHIAQIMGGLLGWEESRVEKEINAYREVAQAELAALSEPDDASSVAKRVQASDVVETIS